MIKKIPMGASGLRTERYVWCPIKQCLILAPECEVNPHMLNAVGSKRNRVDSFVTERRAKAVALWEAGLLETKEQLVAFAAQYQVRPYTIQGDIRLHKRRLQHASS